LQRLKQSDLTHQRRLHTQTLVVTDLHITEPAASGHRPQLDRRQVPYPPNMIFQGGPQLSHNLVECLCVGGIDGRSYQRVDATYAHHLFMVCSPS
jgi:hypothetical protein